MLEGHYGFFFNFWTDPGQSTNSNRPECFHLIFIHLESNVNCPKTNEEY